FFLTSGRPVRVGEIVRRIAKLIDAAAQPITPPAWCWWLARQLAWFPGLTKLVPWRLLHLLDDGLWCDNAKVRRLYPAAVIDVEEGLALTFGRGDAKQRSVFPSAITSRELSQCGEPSSVR